MGTKKCKEQTFELKYTGCLADSASVFLHYGYDGWKDVSECKMKKLKSCYKTELSIPCGTELNFCFKNENGYWDNNYGNNYCYVPGTENEYSFVEISGKETKNEKTTTVKAKAETITKTKAKASAKKVVKK